MDDTAAPLTATPVYLGSVTLLERDGCWFEEHRDANGTLTRTDVIGDLLALNLRLLGIGWRRAHGEQGVT